MEPPNGWRREPEAVKGHRKRASPGERVRRLEWRNARHQTARRAVWWSPQKLRIKFGENYYLPKISKYPATNTTRMISGAMKRR